MVEPGIEPGTSWLVVRNSDHQAMRLVILTAYRVGIEIFALMFRVGVPDFSTVTVRDRMPLPCQQASRALQCQLCNVLNDDDANVRVKMLPYNFHIEK